jgi:hypothetical protein
MVMTHKPTPRILIGALALALSLLLAVSALAAHPKAGKKYSGFISGFVDHGFKQPVSFKVSSDGKRLLSFQWAGFGCFGGGGPPGVDPFIDPFNIHKVATIKVSSSGSFSVKNAKWTATGNALQGTMVTFSTISGRFTTANKATGTITFTQKQQGQTCSSTSHGNPPLKFTVTTH